MILKAVYVEAQVNSFVFRGCLRGIIELGTGNFLSLTFLANDVR